MMERESAVREILQSIGPLFPEDAQRARAARRLGQQDAPASVVAEPSVEQAPRIKLTTAPKPVLASQVDGPDVQKTQFANLAAVLERLTPPQTQPSVRDTIPELVRVMPNVNALRAALGRRDQEPTTAPVAEAAPQIAAHVAVEASSAFTELPSDPVVTESAEEGLVQPEDLGDPEPSADEIQSALAQAIEAQRDPAEKVRPTPAEPVVAAPDFSEDEHDAFVSAIADAILPARPYPAPNGAVGASTAAPVIQALVEGAAEPADEPVVAPVPAVAAPKQKFKRAKVKHAARTEPEVVAAPSEKAHDPEARPDPLPSIDDDELIRQIRVHRDDMVDVDDQIARIDQEIAAEQQALANYVTTVEQKNVQRARLVRLRTSTQRFVDTLQVRAEPVKRQPKEKKSA